MARIRSVDFLPEIFKTPTNKKFLGSTFDQLIQEPKLKQTQGYIGRRTTPGKRATDGYILEPTDERTHYQLEPGVTFKNADGKTVDALSYIGLLDGLQTNGAVVDNHDRMFRSETYAWSPYIDFDKLVNYNQYFWLPGGPDAVNVSASDILLANEFDITANEDTFSIAGFNIENPTITLVRGGSYEFQVDQAGSPFYIQAQPGAGGTMPWASNISSRDVYGVVNNGDDVGTVTFNVPEADAQDFYFTLTEIIDVDLAYDGRMDDIADKPAVDVPNINGIQDYNNKTIVFVDPQPGDAVDLGWVNNGVPLTTNEERYQIFRIDTSSGTLKLLPLISVNNLEKFTIQYGEEYSNIQFFKNNLGVFESIPLTTAPLDTLYYQDASNPDRFGVINIISQEETVTLDIDDINGRTKYISPNGVTFTNGLKVKFRGDVVPAEYADNEYYVEGVGQSIRLVPVDELIVPEKYTQSSSGPWDVKPWDTTGWDGTLNAPILQDYITINRSSIDRNAWSRSNRWFHIDVILKTAEYNNTTAQLDNTNRATRPIIEFDRDLRLFNYGTEGKISVNVIDLEAVDAFSNINGSIGYFVDGIKLENGTRIIFANDQDPEVRNKIYEVQMIDPDNDGFDIINLVPAVDAESLEGNVIVVRSGTQLQGKVYTFTDGEWVESQQKTSVNQAPLFDVFDTNGNSFSDADVYPSTSFRGTKLFSYGENSGASDPVLGFPLKYLNIDNLGDIVFENNFYTDTFLYVLNSESNDNTPVSDGYARKYYTREDFTNEIGWVTAIEETRQSQIFNINQYEGETVELDILPAQDLSIPAVRVSVNSKFLNPQNYSVVGNIVTFLSGVEVGDEIEIKVISDDVSNIAYYEVPANLQSNMFNGNTEELTLGTIRNHYNALAQNILEIEGNINGSNNTRDLGDISVYGNLIVQQSSPVALAAMFMRNKEYNFFNALKFNSRYYEKLKYQLIDWVANNEVFDMSTKDIVDAALTDINAGKNIESSFYWSDMLPVGSDYETTEYVITAISTDSFATLYAYDFTKANTHGLLVYHNDNLLLKDADYTVATDGARITLLFEPDIDDIIKIDEYTNTIGSNVPSTPTKLGLYPKFRPLKYTDDTYAKPTDVIRGHDGSITVAVDDITDGVLLEFEKRIYNNIKVNEDIPVILSDIVPGMFRETEYTEEEILEVLSPHVLSWLGWNRIDHKTQDYKKSEEKTWNYSSSQTKLGTLNPDGNWRGLYKQFYDTDSPHTRPWEMVGLTERPDWWEVRYGPAPYTAGNLVLWDDMEAGLIKEPGNERVIDRYKRPGLTTILPVDGEGNLLTPLDSVIKNYTAYDFKKSWQLGDEGPAESAWYKSSAYPFAVQALLALTKPARYFALMADRDRYTYNSDIDQYLYDDRYRLDSRYVEVPDAEVVKHGYINWIVDYNRHFGFNSVEKLKEDLSNMGVNLVHHMASYTDKNNLKIFTDKSSPDSTNSSLLLPDESFDLLLYKNQPFDTVQYSSVIVQQLEDGYAVLGNSTTDPYFRYYPARSTGRFKDIKVGRTDSSSTTVRIPKDFEDETDFIPYGYSFGSKHAVASFLIGYGEYLELQGLQFNDMQNDIQVNWEQMVQEFIYWADQGWAPGSVINLNPAASVLEFEREEYIVNNLNELDANEQPLNQNKQPLKASEYAIDRIDNNFKLITLNNNVVSYLKFELVNFEHMLILDNESIFSDLIYDPLTSVRQQRLKLSGFTTYEWSGQLDAQGFMYNEDNIQEWSTTSKYYKGDIVKYKNQYWSAASKTQPSDTFDFNVWVKTDYDKINKGLLPNLATKSEQQLQFYNNKTANLEQDVDLMALGLTGYRTRDYLQSLDLDDISQVNIYSDMIGAKGTFDGLNLFQGATLNNEVADYEIYENWAIRRARYGATASRAYVEFNLDGTNHNANPSILEITNGNGDVVEGDDVISIANIFKQSVKHNSKYILPLLEEKNYDTSLLTAGPVDPDDVDIQTFDIASLPIDADINHGTRVWVAKDNEIDWNVYTALDIDAKVICALDNLDGTVSLEFDAAHTLAENGVVVIKDFDDQINGTHLILEVSSTTEIVIAGELAKNQTVIKDVEGSALKLDTSRLQVPSDIVGSRFDNQLFSNDTVWIASTNDLTATYKKADPFVLVRDEVSPTVSNTGFGHSVSQGFENYGMLVGAPQYKTEGGVFCYNKFGQDYALAEELKLGNSTNVWEYGDSVILRKEWGAASAPGNGTTIPGLVAVINRNLLENYYVEERIIVSPPVSAPALRSHQTYQVVTSGVPSLGPVGSQFVATGLETGTGTAVLITSDFGSAIALSDDENWLYVGQPTFNQVHAYQQIRYQTQELRTVIEQVGVNQIYVIDTIEVDTAEQMQVFVNDILLTPTTEYTFNGTYVIFDSDLIVGDRVKIRRRDAILHSGDGIEDTFPISNLYAINGEESLKVILRGVLQRPYIDYTIVGSDVVFTTPPPDVDNNIVISLGTYYKYVTTITDAGSVAGDNFGAAIDTTDDSSHVAITAPQADVDGVSEAGKIYLYDRVIERYVVSDASQTTYPTNPSWDLGTSSDVFVNGEHLLRKQFNIGGVYEIVGDDVIVDSGILSVGDFLDVDTTHFTLVQEYSAETPEDSASFGNAVSICKSKCSIFVGAENANSGQGAVERLVNRTRMYGITQSSEQDPTIPTGGLVTAYSFVVGNRYKITSLGTTDFTLIGAHANEVGVIFDATGPGLGSGQAEWLNSSVRVNNIEVYIGGTSEDVAWIIENLEVIPNVTASASDGYLTIELINKEIDSIANKLDVAAGLNVSLATLGLQTYYHGQVLTSPVVTPQAQHFGADVHIDRNLNQLVVSATEGNQQQVESPETADIDTVTADTARYTTDNVTYSEATGVVYTYDILQDATQYSEGQMAFGQQIIIEDAMPGDTFGNSVNLVNNVLVVGSEGYSNTGRIVIYKNPTNKLSWSVSAVQQDVVDTSLINTTFFYDKETQDVDRYLDYIDPLNGKILGAARKNLDYLTVYNPAVYESQYSGALWGPEQVDKMWWDLSTVRFLDYNLADAKKSAKLWGKTFPGSSVDIYQWVESDATPANYAGTGTVDADEPFVTVSKVDKAGNLVNKYYYWVKNVAEISINSKKTLSADAVSQYIISPVSSGIPYLALLSQNQVAFYNCKDIIDEDNTILHIEYDKVRNDSNVFVEYDLFRQNRPDEFLSDLVYRKLQDSFCGIDVLGNLVPDINLHEQDRYGIDYRPRKSMFVDRFAALKNYLQKVNSILTLDVFAEAQEYTLLNTQEPVPSELSNEWDEKLFDHEELSFQDLSTVSPGHKYLVESDSTSGGLWTIYEVTNQKDLRLIRVQNYDTTRYWYTADWYDATFDEHTTVDYVVENYSSLATINAAERQVAKVTANGDDKWELYRRTSSTWERVALEDGTIQFSESLWDYSKGRFGWDVEVWDTQHFDQEPVQELRYIIRAINEEILVGDNANYRNDTILSVFNYILAEQDDVDWLSKTSLIDVTQNVRSLSQYPIYQKDNQDYLLRYIQEAKPYHCKIKDFLLSYDGLDTFEGHVTDFDCPAYYDEDYSRFISPILDDGAILVTDQSNRSADDEIWTTEPWTQWYNHHKLEVGSVLVTDGGSGYVVAPIVEAIGTADRPAVLTARIGSGGSVVEVIVEDPGSGYLETPTIQFTGGNGDNAVATALMAQSLVRSFKTNVRYDRVWDADEQGNVYAEGLIVMWEPNTVYEENQLVRVGNYVYKLTGANGIDPSPESFNPTPHELVDIESLSGIDRTYGYYVSDVNNPGLDLSLLINGIVFPGVQVDGIGFDQNTGWDVAAWDTVVFDNFEVGPEGFPTYSEDLIDTIYESSFLDTYLGTGPTDINVDGGAFVDEYHSHAPEETVPGIIFDTLDIKVTSRPGADYLGDGHAFIIKAVVYDAGASVAAFSFENIVPHPIEVVVVNLSTGATLYEGLNYTLDWTTRTVNITSGISASDQVKVFVYEIGGGNQLYRGTLFGSDTTADAFYVPVKNTEIYKALVFVNGVETAVTVAFVDNQTSSLTLPSTPGADDFITVTVFGYATPQHEESYPETQLFEYGVDTVDPGAAIIEGSNRHNAIVEVNGLRLRPPEGVRHFGNGTSTMFLLPLYGGYPYADVSDSDVAVYLNDEPLQLTVDFTVSPGAPPPAVFGTSQYGTSFYADPGANPPRSVILNFTPDEGDTVDVYVRHASDYWYSGTELTFVTPPVGGDTVAVTTFNDTSESGILTEVFVGPQTLEEQDQELFDSIGWDVLPWDYESGVDVAVNRWPLSEHHPDANRLWVTLNGERLASGDDYVVIDGDLIITLPVIADTDVVAVTSFSDSVVQNGVNFRLFKDMRDNVGMYKLNNTNTTYLTQPVATTDDIIYVNDASKLGQPNLAIAKFGILIINGERITYRERDLVNNTVSGLRRGTAGTGVGEEHTVGSTVSDVSGKSFVQWEYNKIWYEPGTQEGDEDAVPLQDQTTIPAIFIKN